MKAFRNILTLAVLALTAACAWCARTVEDAAVLVRGGYQAAKRRASLILMAGLELAARPRMDLAPRRALERARAFKAAREKRDSPLITASWRMCPST